MVWCVATIVGLTITGRLSSAKLKYLETVGECREYSPLAIKTLFISGLESEARELYERTIMYNDAGPTVFLPDEIAAFYQIGMKKEGMTLPIKSIS